MILFQLIIDYFKNTFQFKGKTARKDYWLLNIFFGLTGIVLAVFKAPEKVQNFLGGIISIPMISLTSRRYQDAGVSGWFQLPQMMSFLLLPIAFMSFAKKWMKAAVITLVILLNIAGFILTLLPSAGNNKHGRRSEFFTEY